MSILGNFAFGSTKVVQGVMSTNISTTSSILATQGVSSKTVSTAVNSITKGMGIAGVNMTKSMVKIETAATTTSEVSIKTAEDKFKTKK